MIIVNVECLGVPSEGLQFHRLCACELRDAKRQAAKVYVFPGRKALITMVYHNYDPGRDVALQHADDFLNGRLRQVSLGDWL